VRGSYIQIRLFADRLEVQSPGGLYGNVTEENIAEESFTRNSTLMRLDATGKCPRENPRHGPPYPSKTQLSTRFARGSDANGFGASGILVRGLGEVIAFYFPSIARRSAKQKPAPNPTRVEVV
jgi:hypothetical protein